MSENNYKVRTPLFPPYSWVRATMQMLDEAEGLLMLLAILATKTQAKRAVLRALNSHNARQREALRELLAVMLPYQFEHLIGDLMEAMGYEDVTVTKQSGDKGVVTDG